MARRGEEALREDTLARLIKSMMAEPTCELRRAVKLIAVQVARRIQPNARPRPGLLKDRLEAIETDARSLRARLICLQWTLRHQPALRGILRGQFGLFNASGLDRFGRLHDTLALGLSTQQLAQTARNAAYQREHLSLSAVRAEPSAKQLCAMAVVLLHEMTRWHKLQHDDREAKVWCVLLWLVAGGKVPRSLIDPFSPWEWHLRWALGGTTVDAKLLTARHIVRDAVKEAGFIALPVREGKMRNDR